MSTKCMALSHYILLFFAVIFFKWLSIHCYSCNIFFCKSFFIPFLRFEDKVTDKRGRFKKPLNTSIHYTLYPCFEKKSFENCWCILRKLQFTTIVYYPANMYGGPCNSITDTTVSPKFN